MTEFDRITIYLFLFGFITQLSIVGLVYLITKFFLSNITKVRFLKICSKSLIFLILISQITLLYGSFVEPQWIQLKYEKIDINQNSIRTNLKIILVADYHIGPYKKEDYVARTVEMINSENPDIVLIAGDFIYSYADQIKYFKPFEKVKTKYGVYAVLGNHDYGLTQSNESDRNEKGAINKSEKVFEELEKLNINVLRNENLTIDLGEEQIKLVGLEDMWGNRSNFADGFVNISKEDTVLLLEHNPDIILDPISQQADLIMTGHTHGGQIRLPLIGSLAGIPTQIGEKYYWGLFDLDSGNKLYITKGIGEMGPRARLFCRPEIVVINLTV